MGDAETPDTEYQQLDKELQSYYLRIKNLLARFEKRKNVLRDRGTLNDLTVSEHLTVEQFIELFRRVEDLEALTSVLRTEE